MSLAVVAAFWVGWMLACACGRAQCRHYRMTDAMNRRIGWGYGYGAGVVDAKHGRYDPTAPSDGRSRAGGGGSE